MRADQVYARRATRRRLAYGCQRAVEDTYALAMREQDQDAKRQRALAAPMTKAEAEAQDAAEGLAAGSLG